MKFLEVSFNINPHIQENEDLLIAVLSENNYDSFWQSSNVLKSYISEEQFDESVLKKILNKFQNLFTVKYKFNQFIDKNWNEEWEKNFKYVLISDKCLIRAPFHNNLPKTEFEIIIEPKMSFGTGHHSTTSLMIELILELQLKNKNVLDMGCGTGVLAILASLKKAENITAIDIDEWAFKNTIENCGKNNCKNIEVLLGGVDNIQNKLYDVIFANINRNILLKDLLTYCKSLKDEGQIMLSGFLESDFEIIKNKTIECGLILEKTTTKNDWVAVQLKKINK